MSVLNRVFCVALLLSACSSSDQAASPDAAPAVTTELLCDDNIDNDNDQQMDCADDDCKWVTETEGACTNPEDLPAFKDMDLNVEWNACIGGCQLDVACNSSCFAERNNTSMECSTCFAELIPCVVTKCGSRCQNGGGSPDCLACIGEMCTPAYKECFGQLMCSYEYGCRDQIDNDGDGLLDAQDPDCQ